MLMDLGNIMLTRTRNGFQVRTFMHNSLKQRVTLVFDIDKHFINGNPILLGLPFATSMHRPFLSLFLYLFVIACSYGQTITISGFVQDSLSGEKLPGAAVQIDKVAVLTNNYGFFSLRISKIPSSKSIRVSYLGFRSQSGRLLVNGDTTLTIRLHKQANQLETVTIQGDFLNHRIEPGQYRIPLSVLKQAPALLGETDVLKFLQTLPGVQGGTEGTVGFHVRGGSPDQNLVLLDGMPVYNASHLFGFFSVFNPEAIASADFYKSAIPARFSGRLSSVLDLTMKEGDKQAHHGRFALSPVAGNFLLEGPILRNKLSYMVSGRRTWLDTFTNLMSLINRRSRVGYHFDDLNAKANLVLPHNSHLYASWYRSKDRFQNIFDDGRTKSNFGYNWGNSTLSLRYTRLFSDKLFGSLQAGLVNYQYALNTKSENQGDVVRFDTRSAIRDILIKSDFDFSPIQAMRVRFGGQLSLRRFSPETRAVSGNVAIDENPSSAPPPTASHEISVYMENAWELSEQVSLNLGLVGSINLVLDKTYANLQPRLSLQYALSDRMSIKAAYNTQAQYLHLLTNSSLGLPTDLWVPTNAAIRPQVGQQISLGVYRSGNRGLSGSIEAYYKTLDNVLDYREGTNLFREQATSWVDRVVVGSGRSYGLETYLKQTIDSWSGWVSYTLSWNQRVFSQINRGNWFPYTYDRRHVLNAVVTKTIRPRQQLTANFQVNTGAVATLPTSQFSLPLPDPGVIGLTQTDFQTYANRLDVLNDRNNFRLPSYHRLDVSYRLDKPKKRGVRTWLLSCYNIYNRKNPFIVYVQNGQLKQFTLFTIIPSATYSYAF